jgi:hypothetical protein
MPETLDVTPAESSPAISVPTDPEAYAEWRQTGKTSEAAAAEPRPTKRENAAASHDEEHTTDAAGSEPVFQQESIQQQRKPRGNAETRLAEVLQDLRNAGLSPSELKTFRREAQQAQSTTQTQQQPPAATTPPEKTANPAVAVNADAPPKPPVMSDFDDWDKFSEAQTKYWEQLADHRAAAKLAEYQRSLQMNQAAERMNAALADARARYGEGSDTLIAQTANAVMGDPGIHESIKAVFQSSARPVDLLHFMGSQPQDFAAWLQLAKTNPADALRKAALIEHYVLGELQQQEGSNGAAAGADRPRDPSGKFAAMTTAPAKKPTTAPPPPREAGGRNGAAPDEVAHAAEAGDFARFRSAANRRDMAKRKGN